MTRSGSATVIPRSNRGMMSSMTSIFKKCLSCLVKAKMRNSKTISILDTDLNLRFPKFENFSLLNKLKSYNKKKIAIYYIQATLFLTKYGGKNCAFCQNFRD